jgi:hypothetical protein
MEIWNIKTPWASIEGVGFEFKASLIALHRAEAGFNVIDSFPDCRRPAALRRLRLGSE